MLSSFRRYRPPTDRPYREDVAEPRLRGASERRGLRDPDRQVDAALALGAALLGAAGGLLPDPEVSYELTAGPGPAVAGTLAGLALLWRRRRAPAVFLVVTGLGALATVLHWHSTIPVTLLLAGYALGAFATARTGLAALAIALAVFAGLFALRAPYFDSAVGLFNVAQVLVAWLVGLGVAHRRQLATFARERRQFISRTASDEAERAVVEERLNIARLLNARVSSALDEVADAAARACAGQGEVSRALGSIESSTRQASQDLRQLLGTLRAPEPTQEPDQATVPQWPIDVAIGSALVAFNVGSTLLPDLSSALAYAEPSGPVLIGLSVVPGLILLFRRRIPVTALGVVLGVVLTVYWLRWPEGTIPAGLVVACYAVGAWAPWRRARAALLILYATLALVVGLGPEHLVADWRLAVVVTAPWVIGVVVRRHRLRDQEDLAALRAVEEAHAVRLRRAVLDERLAVARDLHDVVSHNLSGIVIQAAAARRATADQQDAQVLHALEQAARTALQDLQEMVLTLHSPAPRRPSPGVTGIDGLVARHVETHGPVTLALDQLVADEPESIQLTVYRVLQEALVNAAKHAPGAAVTVRVGHTAGFVEVEVTNAAAPPAEGVVSSGVGLTGLAERAALHGGTLDTGRTNQGGFRVCMRLPSQLAVRR